MAKQSPEMSVDRFEELLDQYGSVIEDWPNMDQESAETLLGASQEARSLLFDQQKIDKLLKAHSTLKAPKSLIVKIMNEVKNSK